MFRTKLVLGITAAALLTLSACGDDKKTVLPSTTAGPSATDASGSPGDTSATPGDTTATPGGTPADCAALYKTWATAMAGAGAGQSDADITNVFAGLQAIVPADLKDDVAVMSNAYGKYLALVDKYKGDMTKAMADPEVMAAIQDLSTPEVQAAGENISNYFDTACPSG